MYRYICIRACVCVCVCLSYRVCVCVFCCVCLCAYFIKVGEGGERKEEEWGFWYRAMSELVLYMCAVRVSLITEVSVK